MLRRKQLSRIVAAVCTMAITAAFLYATSTAEYRFKIHNKSTSRLVKLLASPDGNKYGVFDIGSGVKPGGTMELVWDKSTDNGNCEWYLKAVFADESESAPAEFDFCEEDLVVEFTN